MMDRRTTHVTSHSSEAEALPRRPLVSSGARVPNLFCVRGLCGLSLFNYNMSLVAYIILRLRYADMARDYVSPCGIAGAVVGLVVMWTATISLFVYVPGAV